MFGPGTGYYGMEPVERFVMLELLEKNDVAMLTKRKVLGIKGREVQVVNLDSGLEEVIEADWVVIAVGARPVDALVAALEGKDMEVYLVGDCNRVRVIMEAVYEGCLVGHQI